MRIIPTALITLVAASTAFAEVQPFNVFLTAEQPSFTVPAGKVYLLEAVAHYAGGTPPTETIARVSITPDNVAGRYGMDIKVADSFVSRAVVWLPQRFRLKAGETLRIPTNGTYIDARYFGLMIDAADLYAANIPAELTNPALEGGRLSAEARFASARPRITKIESSTTLDTFAPDPSGIETEGASNDESVVSVDATGAQKKFMRISATARGR